jgi:hypothetical protein
LQNILEDRKHHQAGRKKPSKAARRARDKTHVFRSAERDTEKVETGSGSL